jgi:hypothetical protein
MGGVAFAEWTVGLLSLLDIGRRRALSGCARLIGYWRKCRWRVLLRCLPGSGRIFRLK